MPHGLAPAVIAELAGWYRREDALWRTGLKAAEVRAELAAYARAVRVAHAALEQLRPAARDLMECGKVGQLATLYVLEREAELAELAVDRLDQLGAGRGGARRLPALLKAPVRFRLALLVLPRLPPPAMRTALWEAMAEVLIAAGEERPERGLDDVVGDALASWANHVDSAPVRPYRRRRSKR